MQSNPLRVFLTRDTTKVLINDLDSCSSYWVITTAIDCANNRMTSSPQLIGVLKSEEFKFDITIDLDQSCTTWISDNFNTKLSDVDSSIADDSLCRMFITCLTNSQFTCEKDPHTVTYV